MKKRHNLWLVAAEKAHKKDFIELMNADLTTGKIKLTEGVTALQDEWINLIWDERRLAQGQHKEHPACDNHLSDAALYAWRWAYNYAWTDKPIGYAPTSEGAVDEFWDKESVKVGKRHDIIEYEPYENDAELERLLGEIDGH